ncbi:MAG TPA: FAD-binding oxidoreductase [Acetobacteraceae bacterium]|nr:FAD-binding oxidoreductase [Acetobacteraceae bacterium]
MLPRLNEMPTTSPLFVDMFAELRARGFEGDLSATSSERIVQATDNSIYQVLPQAIAFPRTTEDLVRIARLTSDPRFAGMARAARGGGTGTNGQLLTDGLVVDVSRHMNRILEINAEERWVRVQTGVVKDQLNAAAAPFGLFFPSELSTSNRATICAWSAPTRAAKVPASTARPAIMCWSWRRRCSTTPYGVRAR